MTNKFQEQLEKNVQEIESILQRYLPKEITLQSTIADAMKYSLLAGGKRLRPMLVSQSYKLYGGDDLDIVAPFMAAIEMIHTYSLVHDDLPAMDNDEYRRGRKTTHIVYGEDMGILAGDALLNYAYETALCGVCAMQDKEAGLTALQVLAKKSGIYGMVGGQVVDVEMTGKALTKQQLDFVFRLKTGALLEAGLMMGAALAGADAEEITRMETVGNLVGMAFQIQDDILDVTSTMEELGKPIHSDEKNEKTTYVSLYGMDEAKKAVNEYSKRALDELALSEHKNEFLTDLIVSLIHRTK